MNNRLLRLLQISMQAADLITLNILFTVLRAVMDQTSQEFYWEYNLFRLVMNSSWILVIWSTSLYHKNNLISWELFCRRTMHAYFIWLLLLSIYLIFTQQYGLSRLFIAVMLLGQGAFILCNRFFYLILFYYLRRHPEVMRKVLIVGYNPTAKKLANYLEEDGHFTEVVGFCEEEQNIKELSNYPILGPVDRAVETSQLHGVQEIYSTISPENNPNIYQLIQQADNACIRVSIIPDLSIFLNKDFHVNYINDIPVLSTRNTNVHDAGNVLRKRFFDVVISSLVIILVLSWLVPLLALLIRLESRGPVFFKQQRSGKNNQPFWCYKFRSMKVNEYAHAKQATRDDVRFTRMGKFLRKTSLDEFPQFFNVLMGDMSIVGPRPHMLKHTEDFSKIVDEYMARQFMKPGITGWAQVNGFRGETKTNEQIQKRVEFDLWYLEHWSLWLDVRIIFLTVVTIFQGDKNAF